MSSKEDGIIVILSSPSGAGKTTLVKILAEKRDFFISISHTTRNPRSNEINGKDYYFVSQEEFKLLIEKNEFLEHAKVFGHSYGSSITPVTKKINEGKNVLFDIDWQGTEQIIKKRLKYKLITFFILPPSKQVLFDRLSNRDMKDKLIVDERMREFNKDVLHWKSYDYVVINDNLDKCYKEISNLIDSEINKTSKSYDSNLIKKHVDKLIT